MRTTINLDDHLLSEAQRLTGTKEPTVLIHAGLTALTVRESARRLARLGGTEPNLMAIPRTREQRLINVAEDMGPANSPTTSGLNC